jgi:hypothetical protein
MGKNQDPGCDPQHCMEGGVPNYTALTLLGHIFMKARVQPTISDDWEKKYGAKSIWELPPAVEKSDRENIKIMKKLAEKHPWDGALAEDILNEWIKGSESSGLDSAIE